MVALIYKKILDEKVNLIFSTAILIILFHVGVENLTSGFIWIAIIGQSFSEEENMYFRTLNFSKKEFFQSNIIFSLIKIIIRLCLVFILAVLFPKTQSHIIYFLVFLYTFFVIETAGNMYSVNFSGQKKNEPKDIFVGVMGFLIVGGFYVWFVSQFFWPMERLVYGSLLITAVVIIFTIHQFYAYKGVHYVENKRIKL